MLNFDVERFVRIETGALALWPALEAAVRSRLMAGAENLFFLGAGGAAILMQPAAQVLATRSTLPVFTGVSAELVIAPPPQLGPRSIVVIPSLSGTTRESLEMLSVAKARGATVFVLTAHGDSPLARAADQAFVAFAEDDTSSESFYLQSLLIALAVLKHRRELDGVDAIVADLRRLPELLVAVKDGFEEAAAGLADTLGAGDFHIVTGAGGCWPEAFYYGMCILEEMQWIRTRPVHASDFFHGTLELVEKGVHVMVLKGEDAWRPLADRVEGFARSYTDRVTVLDAAAFALPGISPEVRALISPVLLATALERVSAHLEVKRNHPLTTRRYYRKVAY